MRQLGSRLVTKVSPPALSVKGIKSVTSVCVRGFTQGTLYTTTTVYGVLVHQEGAICTTKAQYAPWWCILRLPGAQVPHIPL